MYQDQIQSHKLFYSFPVAAMSKSSHPGNILLKNIPWQDLETILFKRQKNGETLLAYDNGTLELITPSLEHQEYREILEEFIIALLDLQNINYRCLGSVLWQRPDLQISLEVDSCFYIQNLSAIEKQLTISLPENPPPDLVLEIDLTQKSLSRRSMYARLGIPAIMYTSLLHEDYHTPLDNAENINYPKLKKMADWMYRTGYKVANASKRPTTNKNFKLER